MKKKMLASLLAVCLFVGLAVPAFAATVAEKPKFDYESETVIKIESGVSITLDGAASVTDGGELTYYWYKNDVRIKDSWGDYYSDSDYTIVDPTRRDAGTYTVEVRNKLEGSSIGRASRTFRLTGGSASSVYADFSIDLSSYSDRSDWEYALGSTDPRRELGDGYSGNTSLGYGFTVSGSYVSGSTSSARLDAQGSTASFAAYAKITGQRLGYDFDKVVIKSNGSTVATYSTANSGSIATRSGDTYIKWTAPFATKSSAGWARSADVYSQQIELYLNGYRVATETYEVDMRDVTYPTLGYGSNTGNSTVDGATVYIPSEVTNVYNPILSVLEVPAWSPDLANFTAIAGNFNILRTYNIELYDGSTRVTNLNGGRARIEIPFGGLYGQQYSVLRYNSDNTITELSALYTDQKISFESNQFFSTYAIAIKSDKPVAPPPVVVPPTKPTTPPATGVDTSIWIILSFVVLAGGLLISRKKLCK